METRADPVILFFTVVLLLDPEPAPALSIDVVSKRMISYETSIATIVVEAEFKAKEAYRKCLNMK